jgi:hypothetical protein
VSEPEDPWPEEPDEPDPEARWDDLEPDAPRIPTPDVDPEDVDPALRATFWRSVLLANVALMAFSLGAMFVLFRGWWRAGAASVAVGLLAASRLYRTYRAFERRRDDPATEADVDAAAVSDADASLDGDDADPDAPPVERNV